jgi:hypothetical protein
MSRDYQALAQPFVGSVAEYQDILFPARTATQIADAADPINTKDKFEGRQVYDTTNQFSYIADGSGPTDTWTLNDGLGATQVTPS